MGGGADNTLTFDQEVTGYLRNDDIRKVLESCNLSAGQSHVKDNVLKCYEALVEVSVIGREELPLVEAWLEDCL